MNNKKRKIEVSSETFRYLSLIRKDIGSFDSILHNYITDPTFSEYAHNKYSGGVNRLSRIPFSLRLLIIQMIPDMELKYFLRSNMVIKSFQTMKDLNTEEYIRELYGIFSEDKTRKIYLIFRRMGIKTSVNIKKRFSVIPQKATLLSFRYHGGTIMEDEETIMGSIPSGMNGLHQGIRCLTFVYIKEVNIDSLILLVRQCRYLDRIRLSEIDLRRVNSNNQKKLSEVLNGMKSVSIIRCKGFEKDCTTLLLESKSLMKLAIGGNLFENLIFPPTTEPNFSMRYLYLQNNFTDVNVRVSNYPNLRIINLSNTRVSYNNLINIIQHPTLRKLVVVHVRLNRNEEVVLDDINLMYPNRPISHSTPSSLSTSSIERRRVFTPSQSLESLTLSSTKLDERFCRYIGKWCKSLSTLLISKCDINPVKISLLKLEEMTNLQTLHIGWNKITNECMRNIIENCPSIGKLVTPQEIIDREFAKIILSSPHLHSISFRSKKELLLDQELLECIKRSNLKYINLIHHKVLMMKEIEFIKYQCLSVKTFKYSYPAEVDRVIWVRKSLTENFFVLEDVDDDVDENNM